MLEYVKILKEDDYYPQTLRNLWNLPNQIYAMRKYRTFK